MFVNEARRHAGRNGGAERWAGQWARRQPGWQPGRQPERQPGRTPDGDLAFGLASHNERNPAPLASGRRAASDSPSSDGYTVTGSIGHPVGA
jgi:hypothetical protein